MSHTPFQPARRGFLRQSGALTLLGAAAPWALNLAALGEAAAATAAPVVGGEDYKALVCVFLTGGNDHANTIVAFDEDSHADYRAARSNLALSRESLVDLRIPSTGLAAGRQMALAPALAALQPVLSARRLAPLLNIGPLLAPTTLADVDAGRNLPPRLFSHNDQQSVWQSYGPEGSTRGWGGLLGDLALAYNDFSPFTCVNAAGQSVFLSGFQAQPYALPPAGTGLETSPVTMPAPVRALGHGTGRGLLPTGSSTLLGRTQALERLLAQHDHPIPLARAHAGVMRRALELQGVMAEALNGAADLARHFPEVSTEVRDGVTQRRARALVRQLHSVARVVSVRARLTPRPRRQVFFVALGGFDLHDGLLAQHPRLLEHVALALSGFDAAMQQLGVSDQVTTFTASDFGRTLTSNGDGSDHGWGGHQLVMGGAVAGGRCFGTAPSMALGGPDDVGQGRLLPSLAVDQLAEALARWMGVNDALQLDQIAPSRRRFDAAPLADLFSG